MCKNLRLMLSKVAFVLGVCILGYKARECEEAKVRSHFRRFWHKRLAQVHTGGHRQKHTTGL